MNISNTCLLNVLLELRATLNRSSSTSYPITPVMMVSTLTDQGPWKVIFNYKPDYF
jgi:hypothetical protein